MVRTVLCESFRSASAVLFSGSREPLVSSEASSANCLRKAKQRKLIQIFLYDLLHYPWLPANLTHREHKFFSRRDKNEVRTLLAILFLLQSLVPAGSRSQRTTPVWINPCKATNDNGRGRSRDTELADVELGGKHRPSPRPLRRVRLQASVTKSHYAGIWPNLRNSLCNKVIIWSAEVNHNWLPQNPTLWYKKKIKCLDKKQKVKSVLPNLYMGLQRYAASLERLRDSSWNDLLDYDCRSSRWRLLNEIGGKINQLLCELDLCMRDLRVDPGPSLTAREARSIFPKTSDLTSAHVVEATVLSSYYTYIRDWARIIKQVVGPKGSRTCVPRYLQPRRSRRNKGRSSTERSNQTQKVIFTGKVNVTLGGL